MYLGRIAEIAAGESIYANPVHPYTRALLSAIPNADPDLKLAPEHLPGEVPTPINPPVGCRFHPRCKYAVPGRCDRAEVPIPIWEVGPGHQVACILGEKVPGAKQVGQQIGD
jgi:oligopeptide/dipeptide ABC transporter ATP-binding protein